MELELLALKELMALALVQTELELDLDSVLQLLQ
jgi:hypothetical protein